MPEVPQCEGVAVPPCDLACEIYRATNLLLPFAFGIVLLALGRAASPWTVCIQRLAARGASVIGTGWILVPPIGRALPDLYSPLALLGFGLAAYVVTQFLLETRHRVSPSRYWPLVVALIGTAVVPVIMRGPSNLSEVALLGLAAACSGAVALGAMALASARSTHFPARSRIEAGFGIVGAAVFLLGIYLA